MPRKKRTTNRGGQSISNGRQIIVKFAEGGSLFERGGRIRADHISLQYLENALKSITGARARLSFPMDRSKLRELMARARRHIKRNLPSLDLFIRITVPDDKDVDGLIRKISQDTQVEYACAAEIPGPPPSTPDFTEYQDYLEAAPTGVNAPFAWFYKGGDGSGIKVCDCELDFDDMHEDLPPVTMVTNPGSNDPEHIDHGTAVLGVLVGKKDGKGITGICHNAKALFASEFNGNRVQCISDALAVLEPGDVLVLEMQVAFNHKPAESDPDIHAAVSTAVDADIVVVAAAGNGNFNLAEFVNTQGKHIWDPSHPDYNDSGAIFVGAGAAIDNPPPRSKLVFSNFGKRVNCQAWGENVVTTGTGNLYESGSHDKYTDSFNGTSSAAPIIAGIAACLQGAAKEAFGAHLSPEKVRSLLSDPANGSPQTDSSYYSAAAYPIGPFPDIPKVFKAAGIFPDVYMRDSVSDTGVEPYSGSAMCWSPDIIARKDTVADPDTEFGVGKLDDANLGESIEYGQKNYVYVRLHNRGVVPDDVTVSVFWTEASTFIHPSTWNLIDKLEVKNISPNEHRVAGPVVWPSSQVPSIGHYCLIGVVNSERDPISIPTSYASIEDYLKFVRDHNNICYRNTTVEDAIPGETDPSSSFCLRGLPDRGDRFRMEIRHALPDRTRLDILIAKTLPGFERVIERRRGRKTIRFLSRETPFRIDDGKPLILDNVFLKRDEEVPVEVKLKLPRTVPPGRYVLYADQYLGDVHLGRVNYMLRVAPS
jgi:hypothetical protein